MEDKNMPCPGVPLLIGSLLDSHFHTLLPAEQPQKRHASLNFREDEFPPLQERSFKRKCQNSSEGKAKISYSQQAKKINADLNLQNMKKPCLIIKNNRIEKQTCPNCQLRVINLETHFNTSFICKQVSTEGQSTRITKPTKQKTRNKPSKMPPTEVKVKKISESEKCKSCQKEVESIVKHVGKSFQCQNMYGLNKNLLQSKEEQLCLGCGKQFVNILLHLRRILECQAFYDIETLEKEKKKEATIRKITKYRVKRKAENEIGFKENAKACVEKCRAKKKLKDESESCLGCGKHFVYILRHLRWSLKCQAFYNMEALENEKGKQATIRKITKFRAKKKAENEVEFKDNKRKQNDKFRAKKRLENQVQFKESVKEQVGKYRASRKENWGRIERLIAFRKATQFGAIFVCVSCHQRMFENGVTVVTNYFKEMVEKKKPGLYHECVIEEDQEVNGNRACYICHTCKETMKRGKMPAMSVKNGLFLVEMDEVDGKLSEIENSLIAHNIVFQKIVLLPKSRMSAVKDRLVNVPVGPTDIINTLKNIPRTPKEAGLIQVKLKRKQEYRNYHKREYIDPHKIFKTLQTLKRRGHPYYQFFDDFNTYHKRWQKEGCLGVTSSRKITIKYIDDRSTALIREFDHKKLNKEDSVILSENTNEKEGLENDEEEYIRKDPIRKF